MIALSTSTRRRARATRLRMRLDPGGRPAFVGDHLEDDQLIRDLTVTSVDPFDQLLRSAGRQGIAIEIVPDLEPAATLGRVLEVLVDAELEHHLNFVPMSLRDRMLASELRLEGPFKSWIRRALKAGLTVVIRCDLPAID